MSPAIDDQVRQGGRLKGRARLFGRGRRSRGQSIVEFAIILPVVLLVVLIALDFGRLFLGWVVLNNAARVGANYASMYADAWDTPGNAARRTTYDSLVRGARQDAGIAMSTCGAEPVPAPVFPSGKDLGDHAEVTLDCDFTPLTPIIGAVFSGNPLRVTASSVFPVRVGAVDGPPIAPAPICTASYTYVVDPRDPLAVTFTNTTTGGSSPFLWDFGDARASTLENPTHTYNNGGTYAVVLRVSGCTNSRQEVTVTEPPPPTPTPDPSASPRPSASPSAAPTPTPEPICTVPAFIGSRKNSAAATWAGAGFSTSLVFDPNPAGNWRIQAQSLVGGFPQPCNAPITLGPDPLP